MVLPAIARNPGLFVGPGTVELFGHTIGAAAMIGLWMRWGRGSFLLTSDRGKDEGDDAPNELVLEDAASADRNAD